MCCVLKEIKGLKKKNNKKNKDLNAIYSHYVDFFNKQGLKIII